MADKKKRRRVSQVDLAKLMSDGDVVDLRKQLLEFTSELEDLDEQVAAKREQKIETAVKLFDAGLPVPVIADIANVSVPAVYKWLEGAGREA
ncbi:MAG: helix-turn-helix domain-containing protein [Thermoleophilaceae bacterium]|nr:helix-turn-helix domain-containing protein [Thermoleophilaceae bacterium]